MSEEVGGNLHMKYAPPLPSPQVLTHGSNEIEETSTGASADSDLHHHDPHHTAGRSLPKCPVSKETIALQYAAFILYCNPTVPLDTDTAELKNIFQAPPRSDGKSFCTWALFELLKKLEKKEIKTWAQLAIDLGVEPPVLEKGQSAQKVQQYAVRLKRWMHAMHVDAFFEYLMGKSHVYWTHVPAVGEPWPENGRDGVAPEEDLALRALLPETRPKRGRRKNEDREESELGKSPSQRPRVHSPTLSDDFLIARASAMGENGPALPASSFRQSLDDRLMPWTAMEARNQLGPFRWPEISENSSVPLSAYPQSAITPTNRADMWHDEPRSAITPKAKARRRHGQAVSSAWPSNSSTSFGKVRGRPPSNKAVTDGPFSTFPANPTFRDLPKVHVQDNMPTATPVVSETGVPHFFPPIARVTPPNPPGRPSRLSLQVPTREGGSVRLATPPPVPTPPPVLLVNGEKDDESRTNPNPDNTFRPSMGLFLSSSILEPDGSKNSVGFSFQQSKDTEDNTNVEALESHFLCEILAAEWLDPEGERIPKCSIEDAETICKQFIRNLRTESGSMESFLINLSALAGGVLLARLQMTRYDIGFKSFYKGHWKLRFGSIQGECIFRASIDNRVDSVEQVKSDETEESWKQKYLDLKQQVKEKDIWMGDLKRGVLDALMESNQASGTSS